jgi:ABC-2 type transport system ATP-binding protein
MPSRFGGWRPRAGLLHELTPIQASLEEAFMRLTGDAVEYHASGLDETHEGAVA